MFNQYSVNKITVLYNKTVVYSKQIIILFVRIFKLYFRETDFAFDVFLFLQGMPLENEVTAVHCEPWTRTRQIFVFSLVTFAANVSL